MKKLLLIISALFLSSCASYKLVDTDDCQSVQGAIKKCREVK